MKDRENACRDQQEGGANTDAQLTPALDPPSSNTKQPHGADIHRGRNHEEEGGTDLWMVILTGLLVLVGGITAWIFYRQFGEMSTQTGILAQQLRAAHEDSISADKRSQDQLKTLQDQATAARQSVTAIQRQMRQDQRAWMRVRTFDIPWVGPNEPPTIPIHPFNTGKTAAKRVQVDVVIEVVNSRAAPSFRYTSPHSRYSVGIIQPGEFVDFHAMILARGATNPNNPQPIPQHSLEALATGDAYIAVFGEVKYRDIFGIKHWLRFCQWDGRRPGGFTSQACVQYNSVDNK